MTELRAVLLTDVVDGPRLTERLGDTRAAELWRAHDRAVRDLLPAWRGVEADRTEGFLLLFPTVDDAVGFAAAFHREVAALARRFELPFAARVGVHWGTVILLETPEADRSRGAKPLEVEGIAKPAAARVMSVALGGQTLVSAEARARLTVPFDVRSHGHWRMKGVEEPVELFEVGCEDAPWLPPPDSAKVYRVVRRDGTWQPVREIRHTLPAERDAFLGRGAELRSLAQRFEAGARLVTVQGLGGAGKTRLVTRFGWTWRGDWPGGVWFCDLSEARDASGVLAALAAALDVPLGREDAGLRVGRALAGYGRCLVVLDNFEQVVAEAASTVARWMELAPDARFLVTSREVLGLPGEVVQPLPPLDEDAAVALFLARAEAIGARLGPEDHAELPGLVSLLDGLPLAIELAAARARLMRPAALVKRMGQRFALLSSPRGRPDRHATLRAMLDWSWELLDADDQAALAQLAVFEGDFDLEAAAAVLEHPRPAEVLRSLVDKSLVQAPTDGRYGLLVSVHAYAAEQLEDFDGRADAEARHAAHYARLGLPGVLESLHGPDASGTRRLLARELDNLVVAARRSAATGDGEPAALAALGAWAVLGDRGPYGVGLDLLRGAQAVTPEDAPYRGRLEQALGVALWKIGRRDEAMEAFLAALAHHRRLGDERSEGVCHRLLGVVLGDQGRQDEARTHFERALALLRRSSFRRAEATVLGDLGSLHWQAGRMDEARDDYERALMLHREVGNRRAEGVLLGNLGNLRFHAGEVGAAGDLYRQALAIHREEGSRPQQGVILGNLGTVYLELGRPDQARTHLEAALRLQRELGDRPREGVSLVMLGVLHLAEDRLDEARRSLELALAIHREVGIRRWVAHALQVLGSVHLDAGRPRQARACLEEALDLTRRGAFRPAECAALGELGRLCASTAAPDEARSHFTAGEAVLREVADPIELGKLLASWVAAMPRDPAAPERLAEAEGLAEQVRAAEGSPLGRRLARAREALSAVHVPDRSA